MNRFKDQEHWNETVAQWRDATNSIPSMVTAEIRKSKLDPELAAKGPKSLLTDPLSIQFAMGYKDRKHSLSYDTLKRVPQQLALISAIIQTRCNQVAQFATPFRLNKSLGFAVKHKNPARLTTKGEREFIQSVEKFVYACGAEDPNPHSPYVRDDFETFLKKLVRDSLMYDQATFEIVPDRKGMPYEFLAVDASTIRIAANHMDMDLASATHAANALMRGTADMTQPYKAMKVKNPELHEMPAYVQIINGQQRNVYTNKEMVFGVRNPRSDIYIQGYGYGELEQLITVITAHLYAEEYNRRFFMQGSAPKGILNIKGDNLTGEQLEAFKREWKNNVEGVENAWRTPMMQAEQGIDWVPLHQSNQEMEYSMWMEYLIKITCFTENTPITMADGSTTAIKDVNPGDVVFSHTGQQRTVNNLQITDHNGPLVTLTAGETIEVTPEHPMWVVSSSLHNGSRLFGEPAWKNAGEIVEGVDYLTIPKKTYEFVGKDQTIDCLDILGGPDTCKVSTDTLSIAPKGNAGKFIQRYWALDEELAYVFGLYVAEGNTTESAAYFTFAKQEEEYVSAVERIATRIGVHSRTYAAKESTANICLHSSLVAEVLGTLFGSKAILKKIPKVIFDSPAEVQRAFISGVFAGDGSVPSFVAGAAVSTLSLVSKTALEQMRHLLFRQNVYSHRYTVTNTGFDSVNDLHRLDINGLYSARMSTWLSGPKGDKLRDRVNSLTVLRSTVYESATYYYVPVSSSRTTHFEGKVYNIEVDGEHTYQAHRFAVHNCAVFLIDPAELNFDMHGGVQQTPLFESSQEWKLKASRDRGLKPMLRFLAKLINDNVVHKLDDNFTFDFVGLDELTEQEKHELRKEQVTTYMTLNEIRRQEDLPDVADGDLILNPTYTTAQQQRRQLEQQQSATAGAGAAPASGGGGAAKEAPAAQVQEDNSKPSYADGFSKSMQTKTFNVTFDQDESWMDFYRGV